MQQEERESALRRNVDRQHVEMIAYQEQVEKDIISANLTFTGAVYEWIDVPSSGGKERTLLESVADALASGKDRVRADLDYRD